MNQEVSRNKWIQISLDDYPDRAERNEFFKKTIPSLPAVYVFYFASGKLYVGSTINLHNRLLTHSIYHTARIHLDIPMTIKYKICRRYGCWLMLEARLIKRLEPQFNKQFRRTSLNESRR